MGCKTTKHVVLLKSTDYQKIILLLALIFRPKRSYFPARPLYSGPSSRIQESKNQETSVHKLSRQDVLNCKSIATFTVPMNNAFGNTQISHSKTRNYKTKDHRMRRPIPRWIRELDAQFQKQHLEANALVDPSNQEAIERDIEEVENHDDRIRGNVSKLLFFLSTSK